MQSIARFTRYWIAILTHKERDHERATRRPGSERDST